MVVCQDDEIFADEGVAGVTEMRWDDKGSKNYKTRPIPSDHRLLRAALEGEVPANQARGHVQVLCWQRGGWALLGLWLPLHAACDASGKAVKLSDLDVAAFKGLTLDKAPFGRMT